MNSLRTTRLAASILFCAFAAPAFAATAAAPTAMAGPTAETPESRVRHLHDQLKITPAQEAQWHGVAQVMLDNAKALNAAVRNRTAMTKGMTALDDLQSYEAIVDAHADGLKKLAVAFKPLYDAMPAAQQKNADAVFGRHTGPATVKEHT